MINLQSINTLIDKTSVASKSAERKNVWLKHGELFFFFFCRSPFLSVNGRVLVDSYRATNVPHAKYDT
ncbi:hypothetical protein [Methylocaldum sp. RMAD-M]|jgi:hypothetical protein|uniref:hypothetical protein n=1 Tax=Methylocaldum sp. RMAD-M TaxID=2806557 RepID=UPI000A328082|nr:hypothetical protein [Methylocaldum sp. RMAD-M]